jgi:hypothetical protein
MQESIFGDTGFHPRFLLEKTIVIHCLDFHTQAKRDVDIFAGPMILLLVVCPLVLFTFDLCFVCPSIDGFLLPLWYLQTLLTTATEPNQNYFPDLCV